MRYAKQKSRNRQMSSMVTLLRMLFSCCFIGLCYQEWKILMSLFTMTAEPKSPIASCTSKQKGREAARQTLSPLVVLGQKRVGSNLLFNILYSINSKLQETTIVPLWEVFLDLNISTTVLEQAMRNVCSAEEFDAAFNSWKLAYSHRTKRPFQFLDFLASIPAVTEKAYFALKVFPRQFQFLLQMEPSHFTSTLHQAHPDTKFIVLWRRRMIESHISLSFALKTGAFVRNKNEYEQKDKNITKVWVDREPLEEFIRQNRHYYSSIRDNLNMHVGRDGYMVVEYNRDLLRKDDKRNTVRKLLSFLGFPDTATNYNLVVDDLSLEKQNNVPLSEAVENWDEVCEWGYCGEPDEWEDIFAV